MKTLVKTQVKSVYSEDYIEVLNSAKEQKTINVNVNGKNVEIKKPFLSPEDWRDQIIYFIMTDRFNNPDNKPNYQWDSACGVFQGGKIKGITENLDYIKNMGFTALWVTPVYQNCYFDQSYHGYGIQNFLSIDKRLGTEEELITLIEQAHARGMYVIFDIVLNHTGEVFKYKNVSNVDTPDISDNTYDINWRNENGDAIYDNPPTDNMNESVWPMELQNNGYFYRHGNDFMDDGRNGDFFTLRKLRTDLNEVQDTLIKSFQYTIAKFDCDGFRIDTLKYIPPNFAQNFGNSMREYALTIGKKNFFTFGEIYDSEQKIDQYIGKNTHDINGVIGVDAALDFPVFFNLPQVIKGFLPPSSIAKVFIDRKNLQQNLLSSHGEAGKYFVTFLDNHDQSSRFLFPGYEDQLVMGVATLISLQGISCIYYGTEQGLHGSGGMDNVREALWGKDNAFNENNPIYKEFQKIFKVHQEEATIRYGRQYFREISGNGKDFGISIYKQGILAFSRILNNEEIVVIASTLSNNWNGYVLVDPSLNENNERFNIIYSNKDSIVPVNVQVLNNTNFQHLDGSVDYNINNIKAIKIDLKPMEILILKKCQK